MKKFYVYPLMYVLLVKFNRGTGRKELGTLLKHFLDLFSNSKSAKMRNFTLNLNL